MPLKNRLTTLCLALVLLAGCQASPGVSYKITLKDGREYLSNGRPDFQRKTGYYRYKTFQNRDALLRADEVLMIEEQGA
ncbi:MAG TPA: YgdI/YgdR family lipoprotein [Prosthecobacter sp.]|nr:YgdI/YgdR family lipoprotein [Prosthecobacter sp.]